MGPALTIEKPLTVMAKREKMNAEPMPSASGKHATSLGGNGAFVQVSVFRRGGQDSTNRKIFRAAVTIGVLSTVAKGGVVLKDLVVAHTFGRSDALDAFLVAFLSILRAGSCHELARDCAYSGAG